MHRGTILIVDDNPTIREMLTEVLEDAGHAVVAAADGQEALELAQLAHPALVLLDLNIPVISGFAFGKAARERGLHAPILLVTADPRAAELVFDEHVVGVVPKPFDLDTVADTVARVLRHPSQTRG
jgi:CheY-like chemotaxis protein